jgi:hypothetical protein
MCGSTTATNQKNDNNDDKSASTTNIPWIARCWLAVYDRLPTVTIGGLNVSMTLLAATCLASVRFLAEHVLVTYWGWPAGHTLTKEAAASCGSITHSTLLCMGLIVAFATQKCDPSARMDDAPLWWQRLAHALLQFCTGYMVYDAVVNILYLRWDPQQHHPWSLPVLNDDDRLFLIHHIMTSTYMTSARILQAGHMSAMVCMLLGELTNPLHNMYMMGEVAMQLDCCNGPAAQQWHSVISVVFAAMYSLFRAVLAPPVFAVVSYRLLFTQQGRSNIPLPLNLLWNFMIWAVVFGSGSWIQKCNGILWDFVSTTTYFYGNTAAAVEGDKEL